jgi:uncharacterized RDD family membrane protein YckC
VSDEPGDELYAGLVTRGVAFALDAAVINLAAIVTGVVVGLALSVLNIPDRTVTLLLAIGGCLYVLWNIAYFVVFWSTTAGQTLGSRMMQIRVREAQIDRPLRPRRAFVRLIGTMLAAIPLLAGFLPVLVDARRRGFHDWLARSVVVHVPPAQPGRPGSRGAHTPSVREYATLP